MPHPCHTGAGGQYHPCVGKSRDGDVIDDVLVLARGLDTNRPAAYWLQLEVRLRDRWGGRRSYVRRSPDCGAAPGTSAGTRSAG